jgi:hypothetical protein
MSATLNLGTDGNWATKENSLLGYNSENGNYKPLPFDFTRASNGTFVNKSGLIETAANGVPRIDFSDSTSGALLLEPQRSNLITYSEAFDNSYWIKPQASVVSGQSSPSGDTNAFKLVEDTSNNFHWLLQNSVLSTAGTWSYSIFAKAGERDYISMGNASSAFYSFFDLQNGTVVSSDVNAVGSIESFSNGWYRCTVKLTTTVAQAIGVFISTDGSTTNYQGDGTSGVYIYGAQFEQGSNATSLINTQGSAVTRVEDSCSQTVPSGIINSSEGVLYAEFEISDLSTSLTYPIAIYGTGATIQIYYRPSSQSISFLSSVGGVQYLYHSNINPLGLHKVALAYKNNEYSAFADGVLLDRQNSGNVPSPNTLNVLGLKDSGSSNFSGKVKDVRVYNTALTDAELAALTTI